MCGSASGTRSRVRECVNPQLGCDPSNGGTISVINGVMYETQVRPCLQTDECSVGKLLMFSYYFVDLVTIVANPNRLRFRYSMSEI